MTLEQFRLKIVTDEAANLTAIREKAKEETQKVERYYDALSSLGKLGEDSLDSARWSTYWLFNPSIKVDDKKDFRTIKEVVGKLQQCGIEPVPRKHKKVKVTLTPVNKDFAGFRFSYERKLLDTDNCKIVTVTTSERRMVCAKK